MKTLMLLAVVMATHILCDETSTTTSATTTTTLGTSSSSAAPQANSTTQTPSTSTTTAIPLTENATKPAQPKASSSRTHYLNSTSCSCDRTVIGVAFFMLHASNEFHFAASVRCQLLL